MKHTGDGIMAAFDKVANAVNAAADIQRRFSVYNAEASLRRLDLAEETDARGLRTLWFAGRAALRRLIHDDEIADGGAGSRATVILRRSDRRRRPARGGARLQAARLRSWQARPSARAKLASPQGRSV